jgi:alpha-amylase
VNWCDATGGTTAAFDFTTKGILQEALGRNERWRLTDAQVHISRFTNCLVTY